MHPQTPPPNFRRRLPRNQNNQESARAMSNILVSGFWFCEGVCTDDNQGSCVQAIATGDENDAEAERCLSRHVLCGFCSEPQGRRLVADGHVCLLNRDCHSAYCHHGNVFTCEGRCRAKGPDGEACTEDFECLSAMCECGECKPTLRAFPNGVSCRRHSDCGSRWCAGVNRTRCGECTTRRPEGGACGHNHECQSRICICNKCQASVKWSVPDFDRCETNNQCQSGWCKGGGDEVTCSGVCHPTGGVGADCIHSEECQSGHCFCNECHGSRSRKSKHNVLNGGACQSSSNCVSRLCVGGNGTTCGECRATVPDGGSCTLNAECRSRKAQCVEQRCKLQTRRRGKGKNKKRNKKPQNHNPDGESCRRPRDCESKTCTCKVCRPRAYKAPDDEACLNNSHCESNNCVGARNKTCGTCQPAEGVEEQ